MAAGTESHLCRAQISAEGKSVVFSCSGKHTRIIRVTDGLMLPCACACTWGGRCGYWPGKTSSMINSTKVHKKRVTSKRHYMYQRLDGEASISYLWQQVSRQSQVRWSPWLRHGPITGRPVDAWCGSV